MFFSTLKRILSRLRTPWGSIAFAICMVGDLCMLGIPASRAQSPFSTKNAYVEADVSNEGAGLISIFYFANGVKERLSFDPFSILTIDVEGTYYSNNSFISSGMDWDLNKSVPITAFPQGTNVYHRDPVNHYDTIETTWHMGKNTYDIIQDVYPVLANSSGQIVYKWSIRNYQSSSVPAQVQFLLDVETSGPGPINPNGDDDPKITTREGYNESAGTDYWHNFTTLPPYFLTTEYDLCSSNFPGEIGCGYTVDDYAPVPLGLTRPTLMANVDYKQYVANGNPPSVWGYPYGYNNTPMSNDNAILFQWQPNDPGPGSLTAPSMVELGRGSYGTAPCVVCFGNLDATLLHTERIHWTPSGYVPNHFAVDAIIWNSNSSTTAKSAVGTQTIWNVDGSGLPGPVQIVSPTPVSGGGYSQSHGITSGGSMNTDSVVDNCRASWIGWEDTLIPDRYLINCSTDSEYHIQFTLSAGGFSNTNFIQPPLSEGGCSCDVWVDCQEKDVNPPRHTKHIYSGSNSCHNPYICTIDSVYDNRSTDLGLQSITYTVLPTAKAVQVVGVPPTPLSGCPPWTGPIVITQKDTLVTPCVYFTYTDCAGNQSFDTVCFGECIPPTLIDTQPPRFWLKQKYNWNVPTDSSCSNQCSDWVVTDTITDPSGRQKDLGLDSIIVVSNNNMSFTLKQPVSKGMPMDSFTVCVTDPLQDGFIIIKAKDMEPSGFNVSYDTIRYCTNPDTKLPVVSVTSLSVAVPSTVTATDSQAWDRGVDTVMLTSVTNCAPVTSPLQIKITKVDSETYLVMPAGTQCPRSVSFQVAVIDSFKSACFTTQAKDCAGNLSYPPTTTCYNALSDTFCPTIDTVTLPDGELSVTISDVHVVGSDTILYDQGIDSIWFSCANNVTLDSGSTWQSQNNTLHTLHGAPTGGNHPKFQKLMQFKLYVTDTTSQSANPPCVCINGVDGAGNGLRNLATGNCGQMVQWCSNVAQDTHPPVLAITNPSCQALAAQATDSQLYDRGVYKVWLDSLINFAPLADSIPAGQPTVPLMLNVPDTNQSSYARLNALDLYGFQSTIPARTAAHTTASDVWIYKQDLAMNGSGIAEANTRFSVPVYLLKTDSIPLAQKNLWEYQFTFHLTGTPLVSFVGTKRPASLPAAWTITPAPGTAPGGSPYTITGQGPALTDLQAPGTGLDTLVYLVFQAASSTDVELAQIQIDPDPCGRAVVFNGGTDTNIAVASFTAQLPAPSGRLNGGTVILKDSCATIIGDHPIPTLLSLEPARPNPAGASATVTYTVPGAVQGGNPPQNAAQAGTDQNGTAQAEAPVALDLFDAIGRKVRAIVDEPQKQGTYTVQIATASLPKGLYFLRLASQGKACVEQLTIQ